MKSQCAWCSADMGEKEPFDDNSVTHGICPSCAKKTLGEARQNTIKPSPVLHSSSTLGVFTETNSSSNGHA